METSDAELTGWDAIIETSKTGNPTSSSQAQTMSAYKLTIALANLRLAVFNHQKITGKKLEDLTISINSFNDSSGKLAKSANWLALALVILGVAQLIAAFVK